MRQGNPSVIRDYDKPKNHHGFVYVRAGKEGRVPLWEMRKPTPDERLSIIENYIRMHGSEGPIKVSFLAEKLGVSDRTIQSILRLLEEKKAITIKPVFNENGKQRKRKITGRHSKTASFLRKSNPEKEVFRLWERTRKRSTR